MQVELRRLQQSLGITFILVTHDQEEALIMSDRIAVMFEGKIAQLASPEELYRRPNSRRVASFIGAMNFLDAQVTSCTETGLHLNIPALGEVEVPQSYLPEGLNPQDIHTIGIRPEMLTVLYDGDQSAERIAEAQVVGTSYYGDMTYYSVLLPGHTEEVMISMRNTAGRSILSVGRKVSVGWGADSIVLISITGPCKRVLKQDQSNDEF